jgi:hypothetical protein
VTVLPELRLLEPAPEDPARRLVTEPLFTLLLDEAPRLLTADFFRLAERTAFFFSDDAERFRAI